MTSVTGVGWALGSRREVLLVGGSLGFSVTLRPPSFQRTHGSVGVGSLGPVLLSSVEGGGVSLCARPGRTRGGGRNPVRSLYSPRERRSELVRQGTRTLRRWTKDRVRSDRGKIYCGGGPSEGSQRVNPIPRVEDVWGSSREGRHVPCQSGSGTHGSDSRWLLSRYR